MERNCEVPFITTMMIMKMEGCSMIGKRGSLILALVGEADFRTLIGEIGFLILSVIKEKDTQILVSLGFLL